MIIVIPAEAGIQKSVDLLDSRLHGNDEKVKKRKFKNKLY
jgi:hypothetical protein